MIEQMDDIFSNCSLDGERTLFECAFYDFNHLYFEETTEEDLISMGDTKETLIYKWLINPVKYKKYKKIAIKALQDNQRPDEKINYWKDVSYYYAYNFSNSSSFLSKKGTKFFFIASMYLFLQNRNEDDDFLCYFLIVLEFPSHDFSCLLDNKQKRFIVDFIELYFPEEELVRNLFV